MWCTDDDNADSVASLEQHWNVHMKVYPYVCRSVRYDFMRWCEYLCWQIFVHGESWLLLSLAKMKVQHLKEMKKWATVLILE